MPENTDQNDAVFRALSHRVRRSLVDAIQRNPGAALSDVTEIVGGSRQAVRKHVDVLVEASLVHVVDDERSKRLYYNAVPLQELYDRWTDERSAVLARQMLAVKADVERKEDQNHG